MTAENRSKLKEDLANNLPDNSERLITPADMRGELEDIIDTMYIPVDDNEGNTQLMTSAEKLKLSGIEANATADMSNAEIKSAYEANANTNAFDDAAQSKLDALDANSDPTISTLEASNAEVVTPESGDYVFIQDSSDGGALKRVDTDNLGGSGGGSGNAAPIAVSDDGNTITSSVTGIDFVGSGVAATANGDSVTVTINTVTSDGSKRVIETYNGTFDGPNASISIPTDDVVAFDLDINFPQTTGSNYGIQFNGDEGTNYTNYRMGKRDSITDIYSSTSTNGTFMLGLGASGDSANDTQSISMKVRMGANTSTVYITGRLNTSDLENVIVFGGEWTNPNNEPVSTVDLSAKYGADMPSGCTYSLIVYRDSLVGGDSSNNLIDYDNSETKFITSDNTAIAGAAEITNIVVVTQAEYDAIANTDPNTFYAIANT